MFSVRTALLAMLIPVCAFGQPPADFSGTWAMDSKRSESAHQDVAIGPVTLAIQQTASEVTIETIRQETKKSPPVRESLTYRLDGSESKISSGAGAQVVTKAHWDGTALVTETIRNVENSTVTTLYVHRLDSGGRELSIEKTLTVQHGYQSPGARTAGHGKDVFVKKAD